MKEKGIEQYIETAEYITTKYKNTEFHILGFCEQEYEEKLKKLNEKKIILYHGMQKDVIPFLKECSCLIHPSYYPEGMSNVLLEASASGRPVITTNRSGCREIVEDGVTGFIVETKNSNQLIEKVNKFIDSIDHIKTVFKKNNVSSIFFIHISYGYYMFCIISKIVVHIFSRFFRIWQI